MTSLGNQSAPSTVILLILPSVLLLLTFLFLYPNELKIQSYLSACRPADPPSAVADFVGPVAVKKPDFHLLIGVLTHPDNYERRQLVRLVYSLRPPGLAAHIDVRFVFCKLASEEQAVLVALEIMRHDDIIILDCMENMNFGKTYHYFSSLPKLFDSGSGGRGRPYDYVMKMDDDTYFRLDNLAESLRSKPREDMYYGLEIPCKGEKFPPFPAPFMTGMGYVVSWDLVEWIAESEIARNHTIGPEDMLVGMWLSMGSRGKNWYGMGRAMYDYKGWNDSANCFRHELAPDTVAVHMLKNNSRWAHTLKYFNVTHRLNPSKLYQITP